MSFCLLLLHQLRIPEWRHLSDLLQIRMKQRETSVPLIEGAFHKIWHTLRPASSTLQCWSRRQNRHNHFWRGLLQPLCSRTKSDIAIGHLFGSRRMDRVMIRPPGIDNWAFVVSPDTVWYARVLLLVSASAKTDTGSKSIDCALVSTLETYDDPENGNYLCYTHYCNDLFVFICIMTSMPLFAFIWIMTIMHIISIIADWFLVGWLESVGSRVVYELDLKKPIL